MYFNGPPGSGKTQKLVDIYIDLINKDVNVEKILVICSNAYRKQDFTNRVKEKLYGGFPHFKIYTFHGVAYNTVKDFWPLIEARIKGKPEILPHLTGLETCEFLLKECVREQNTKKSVDLTFQDFYGDRSLITQLIRRYRLMCENSLSFEDLLYRSEQIGQDFATPANEALKCLKIKASKIKVLDFVSQMNAFSFLLKTEKQVQDHFANIEYLLLDDYDESVPACQDFVNYLVPKVKQFYMTLDLKGGTRRGYLGAYPDGWKKLTQANTIKFEELTSKLPLEELANKLFSSIKNQKPEKLPNVELHNQISRVDQFEELNKTLDRLIFLENNSIEDIVIITPIVDDTIKATIQEYCSKHGIKHQFLTGSNKPIDNPKVFGALIIAQLINPHWKLIPSPFDIRAMLTGVLELPPLIADTISQEYEKTYKDNPALPNILLTTLKADFGLQYQLLLNLIEIIKTQNMTLYGQFIKIFSDIIAPSITENEVVEDYNRILGSLKDFVYLMNKYEQHLGVKLSERDWLLQVKNEHVAENPVAPTSILPDALIIATPQKIVDIELHSKYQIWLDVSSSAWTRTQTAALYNAWAYSNYYDGSQYDDTIFTHTIAAHMLRGLVYNCNKEVIALASTLDSMGNEQQGWLIKYLGLNNATLEPQNPPVLRDDQIPVIEYTKGTMAVSAVPGAGKTFVNIALIVKLIQEGVNPANILVLTYMDSAAQTLIGRIKEIFPNMNVMPQISTIHGLAYKIIRDDDNLARLGLPDDLDVADDAFKDDLFNAITSSALSEYEDFNNKKTQLISAISYARANKIKPVDIARFLQGKEYRELREFYQPYKMFNEELEHRGLIDFDDQIRFAIELLEKHFDLRQRYQDLFHFIIEDEAQDSTKLQQRMLSLLVKKEGNYIRTGDVNQAIMTTFTPVDVEGFRDFINNANTTVTMDHSQRSSEPIYTAANELIKWTKTIPELSNSFLDIEIKPTNNNPNCTEPVYTNIFKTTKNEMDFVAKQINDLKKELPQATYAVLVRTNKDAISWTKHLDSYGIPCICLTENIQQKKVFNIIHNYLKVIYKPYNNNNIQALHESMLTFGMIEKEYESEEFIKKLGSPFVSFGINQLPTSKLVQFYIDILYWLEYANIPVTELILKMTQEIFDDAIDRSNGYILSVVAEKFKRDETKVRYKDNFDKLYDTAYDPEQCKPVVGLPETIKYFNRLVKMKKVKGFKFLEKEDTEETSAAFVQIMTIHKSKGMGFDVVFVPNLWDKPFYYFASRPEYIRVDQHDRLKLQLMELAGENFSIEEIEDKAKQNQIEENMRLIYVAITRAKQRLYLTSSNIDSDKGWEKEPSRVLQHFIEINTKLEDKMVEQL